MGEGTLQEAKGKEKILLDLRRGYFGCKKSISKTEKKMGRHD